MSIGESAGEMTVNQAITTPVTLNRPYDRGLAVNLTLNKCLLSRRWH